ncbi:XrtB/PEP-CTERM-associated polysaccharide biosynthesis outer membrane protein EpsL [Variovorax sp. LT1P1]|uniref:XrtB/PEP-CTERM-associated polysaccharide biosynthesis outer membrane protein EpsL n=1 Tax=Variovorax sp. LT1P1 TaxID=3443730 RepID=UPI003F469AFB
MRPLVFIPALACLCMTTAWADAADTVNLSVGYAMQFDSNLFRLPDSADSRTALGSSTLSERIGVTSVALSLDKTYSLQRFQLSGSLINYHYQNFGYLSFNAFNYGAAWQWSLTPRIRGTITTDRNQVLNSFSDYRTYTTRNVRTDKTTRVEGEADLGAAVRMLAGLDSVRRTNEVPGVLDGDRSAQGVFIGLRYVFPSGSTVSYRFRKGDGESNNGLDLGSAGTGRFDDQLHELQASWVLTAKTTLYGTVGHLSRKYPDAFSRRDFDGPVADVSVQWDITGKTSLNAALRRELINYQSDISNYVISDRVILKPRWKATSRISVLGTFEYAQRSFGGSPLAAGAGAARSDSFQLASFGVEWQALNSATVSLMLLRMKNTSNYAAFAFESTGASISARLVF